MSNKMKYWTRIKNKTKDPRIVVMSPQRTFEVPILHDVTTIGSEEACDIIIADPEVSKIHAFIIRRGNKFIILDLMSDNGIWYHDERVTELVLVEGLSLRISKTTITFKGEVNPNGILPVQPSLKNNRKRSPIIFIPGFGGSKLWRGNQLIWPNPYLLVTNPTVLRLPEYVQLQASGVIDGTTNLFSYKRDRYIRLKDFLINSLGYIREHDYFEFSYDWRPDVRKSAQRLAEAIYTWKLDKPATIIAHSMGSIVGRYYADHLGGAEFLERLIFIGGPHRGTPKAIYTLLSGPDLFPFGLFNGRFRDVMLNFPSLYQMIPNYPCIVDENGNRINPIENGSWLPERFHNYIRDARAFHEEIQIPFSVPSISIFGFGIKTITGIRLTRDTSNQRNRFQIVVEPFGDGTVPEKNAHLAGSAIYPIHQFHRCLYSDPDVFKFFVTLFLGQN